VTEILSEPAGLAVATVVGLCLGSFANVLIWRLPRDLSPARGRSQCPRCAHAIAWYDNLPVAGWLLLRGRCRHCREAISPRYPLVEAAGGALAAGCWLWLGATPAAAAAFVLVYLLGVIAVIDWQHMIIPHSLTIAGMIAGLALAEVAGPGLPRAILGLLVGGAVVWGLSAGYKALRGQAGMGGGDVMLMAMVGTFLGPWAAAAVLGFGALLGTVYVLVRGGGRLVGTAKLPFGTFLAGAAVVVLVVGPALWTWYLGLLT
jgi:leader peptidase (prepilin peptidase)/N-methyltransferase